MKIPAFSLLDVKTGHFNIPFFMAHRGQAVRAVMELGTDMSTSVARFPADFILCVIGEFDDQTGVLVSGPPEQLGTVASFLPVQPRLPLQPNSEV